MNQKENGPWVSDACLPAVAFDVAANETWLEEMERQGFRVGKIVGSRVFFTTGGEAGCRCRMQPLLKRKEKMDEERTALYARLGWEYVGVAAGMFHLWRCTGPAAPELDTDPVVQGGGYRYLKGRMMRRILLETLFFGGLLALVLAMGGGSTMLLRILTEAMPFEVAALLGLLAGSVIREVQDVRAMIRLLRRLKAGIPLERPRPYRMQRALARGMTVLAVVWLVMGIAGRCLQPSRSHQNVLGNYFPVDGENLTGLVCVDPAVLGDTGQGPELDCAGVRYHELASKISEVRLRVLRQTGPGEYLVTASADTVYFDLRGEFLARRLVKEIQSSYRSFGNFREIEEPELDTFAWCGGPSQIVVASREDRVMAVYYTGNADLREWTAYFAGLLE